MPVAVEEQVLGLQISVDDILGMQIFECQRHFGRIEFSDGIWEALSLSAVDRA